MSELYSNFHGYLKLNIPRINWVLFWGFAFTVLFYALVKKGYAKQYQYSVKTLICGILLSLSASFIFVMTLFRGSGGIDFGFRVKPFESYYIAFVGENMEVMLQIIINIVMFIPIGFLLPCCFRLYEKYRYVLITTVIVSILIELFQLIFKIGLFETDDIINNVSGAIIGFGFYRMVKMIINHDKETILK